MKQTLIHLSDLHFRPNWPEEVGLVWSKFIADLSNELKHFEAPLLVFSGDLVQGADDTEQYSQFLDEIAFSLNKIGITKEKRIVVPGNHDVSRNAIKDRILSNLGALSALTDEESFLRELPALSESSFKNKFHKYSETESSFASFTTCSQNLGGRGWELENGIGVYCLNTALCSFAGLENPKTGTKIDDKGLLSIDTRSLYQWEKQTNSSVRILIMHHPLDWLTEWARIELEDSISKRFDIILFGHFHRGISNYISHGSAGCTLSMAPPLFTRKSNILGYSFVTIDTDRNAIEILYRQWAAPDTFVLGTSFSKNDTGTRSFPLKPNAFQATSTRTLNRHAIDTTTVLEAEFLEASTCCSSKRQIWVGRDVSKTPETAARQADCETISALDFCQSPTSCVIRAPSGFGLTCLAKFIAYEHHKYTNQKSLLLYCDTTMIEAHRQGVVKYVSQRCLELNAKISDVKALILERKKGSVLYFKYLIREGSKRINFG